MNVLSLFDGISCGQVALNRAGIKYNHYYASEVKPHAIKCTQTNYPKTIQLGSVLTVNWFGLPKIDLLMGGSPCKGISGMNQKREGLNNIQSRLFWEFVRIKKQLHPKYFLLENVHGHKEARKIITEAMEVEPISINSKLVCAQNRPRLYWTNIPGICQPDDRNINADGLPIKFTNRQQISEGRLKWLLGESGQYSISKMYARVNPYPKYGCLLARSHASWNENLIFENDKYYHLSQREIEWIQTLPENYTNMLTYPQACQAVGDGWTVDVISHILSFIK